MGKSRCSTAATLTSGDSGLAILGVLPRLFGLADIEQRGGAVVPIFTAGRLKSGVRLARALRDQALVAYEKSIATAFREVSDALVAHEWTRAGRFEQEKLVVALADRKRLAYLRYHGGLDTQLNALDADRDLLQAELNLAQIRYSELVSVVLLYRALGGGWQ